MTTTLTGQDVQRKRRARPFQRALHRWMMRRAREEASKQIKILRRKGDKWVAVSRVRKAVDPFAIHGKPGVDRELIEILMRFGVAQAADASKNITDARAIRKVIDPKLLQRELTAKDFRLKTFTVLNKWATVHAEKISKETEDMVKRSIRQILEDASGETPLPSPGEMARRVRTQFHGRDATKRIFAWSPERAALIVRTELNMAHGVGTHKSYQLLDKVSKDTGWEPRKRWLAKRDGRSGDRRHDEMHGVTIPIDQDFVLPDGTRMAHPGDPSAPIRHLANCRCAERIVMVRREKR